MNFDWNWFFSSFCQSAAALIGIIGAFIISRLLGLSEKINSSISQFDNLVIEFNRIKASLSNRHFQWYTKSIVKYSSDIKEAIKKGEYDNLSDEEMVAKLYKSDSRLFKIDSVVFDTFKEIYDRYRPKKTVTSLGGGLSFVSSPMTLVDSIQPAGLWDGINEEREAINKLEIEAKTLIQYFQQNYQDLNSFGDTIRPLKLIIILLMISFPLTVIYPLHFMPVIANQEPSLTFNIITIVKSLFTLKMTMLFVFFLTIEGIFYYFLTLTNQLSIKLSSAIKANSIDFRNIKSYSDYFEEK